MALSVFAEQGHAQTATNVLHYNHSFVINLACHNTNVTENINFTTLFYMHNALFRHQGIRIV